MCLYHGKSSEGPHTIVHYPLEKGSSIIFSGSHTLHKSMPHVAKKSIVKVTFFFTEVKDADAMAMGPKAMKVQHELRVSRMREGHNDFFRGVLQASSSRTRSGKSGIRAPSSFGAVAVPSSGKSTLWRPLHHGVLNKAIVWSHPHYDSILLKASTILSSPQRAELKDIIPECELPHSCSTIADVVALISNSKYWDPILFCRQGVRKRSGKRFRLVNSSNIRSPRLRKFSVRLGQGTLSDNPDRQFELLYQYPRQYSPRTYNCMSPMPESLMASAKLLHSVLHPILPLESQRLGPFNFVEVRGMFEALDPLTGEHSDNGQLDADGLVDGGALHWQAPNTAVVIYMFGPTSMHMHLRPTVIVGKRAPETVTIPLPSDHVLVFMPDDDCTCKHSVSVTPEARRDLHANGYRIAIVFRHVVRPGRFDALTRYFIPSETK